MQHNPCDRHQKGSFGFAHLVFLKDENAATIVEPAFTGRALQQAIDPVLEILFIAGLPLAENDQVDHQTAFAPVGMGQDHVAEQVKILTALHAHQQDRIIS